MAESLLPQNNYFNAYCNSLHAKTELYINNAPVSSSFVDSLVNSEIGDMGVNYAIVSDGNNHRNCHASNNLIIDDDLNNVSVTNSLIIPYASAASCVILNDDQKLVSRTLLDGQILIGDSGSVPISANLIAGTNVNIVNGPGSITISSSGGGSDLALQEAISVPIAGTFVSPPIEIDISGNLDVKGGNLSVSNGSDTYSMNIISSEFHLTGPSNATIGIDGEFKVETNMSCNSTFDSSTINVNTGNLSVLNGNISVGSGYALNCNGGSQQVFQSPDAASAWALNCANSGVAQIHSANSYNFDNQTNITGQLSILANSFHINYDTIADVVLDVDENAHLTIVGADAYDFDNTITTNGDMSSSTINCSGIINVHNGSNLQLYDPSNGTYLQQFVDVDEVCHFNGVNQYAFDNQVNIDSSLTVTNTITSSELICDTANISSSGLNIISGNNLQIYDPSNSSYLQQYVDVSDICHFKGVNRYEFDNDVWVDNGIQVTDAGANNYRFYVDTTDLHISGGANIMVDVVGSFEVNTNMLCTDTFNSNGSININNGSHLIIKDPLNGVNFNLSVGSDTIAHMTGAGQYVFDNVIYSGSNIVQTNENGASGSRPFSPFIGQQFYDTTLGYPIYWNGSIWTNALGVGV